MNMFVEKYILTSGFSVFLEAKVLGNRKSAYFNVCLISSDNQRPIDSRSKFQMFTLFSGRHVCVPWR